MKRNIFIRSLLGVIFLPTSLLSASFKNSSLTDKGFKINAGEGRYHGHIQLKGVNSNILDVKISGKDTNGELAIFEQTSLSQGRGTPEHIHLNQDEIFFVIDGEYLFMVGGVKYKLQIGDSIFLPRNIPHAWTQLSEKGKMTVTVQPAGKLEEFFMTMSALEKEPTAQEVATIFGEHEMKVTGPPLKLE
ncbi:hypothetical protein BH11BAC2_BH11BAC2_00550 [soil metagenome]